MTNPCSRGERRRFTAFLAPAAACAALLAATLAAPVQAVEDGDILITPMLGYYNFSSDARLDDEWGPGLAVGMQLNDRWGLEGSWHEFDTKSTTVGGNDVDVTVAQLTALYTLFRQDGWQPYFAFGAGVRERDKFLNDDEAQVHAGFGVFRQWTDEFSLRADLRGLYGVDETRVEPMFNLGLTFRLGQGPKVRTPVDSDRDGVPDVNDACPDSPFGSQVDSRGCPPDSDRDGVVDSADQCPGTPRGVAVDRTGCPRDGDNDGVPDSRDDCPDTAPGVAVDERGCNRLLEQTVTFDLLLEFDLNSSVLRPEHGPEIDEVAEFMRRYPDTTAVIEGHTDDRGAAAYNQALSERRAYSVRDYLINRAGIAASRLEAVGYGESRPKVPNTSEANYQRNRRVSVVIAGQAKVPAQR